MQFDRKLEAFAPGFRALLSQRIVQVVDGPGRGQRLLQIRNASGLAADIALDRGCDIASLEWCGVNLGWAGPVEPPVYSSLPDDEGLGLLRSFDGVLVTCGLDHYGVPATGPAGHFIYPNRPRVTYPLHGRIAALPARLMGYGIDLEHENGPCLWCEAEILQTAVFAESLVLKRRIEVDCEGGSIRVKDHVRNASFRPTRHGLLYHINLGYPLLNPGTRIRGVDQNFVDDFAANPPIPDPDVVERFTAVRPTLQGQRALIVIDGGAMAGGARISIGYDSRCLPAFGVWQAYQSGIYALGIEPHTGLGDPGAPFVPGHPDFLEAGEERRYGFSLSCSSDE